MLFFVASQLHRIDGEADAVLWRDRLQYLSGKNRRWSSRRAQGEEWSDTRKDTGEWTGQVCFVFDHIFRDQRVEMCGRKAGCAYVSNFVFAFFDVNPRIFDGAIVLPADIYSLIKTQYLTRSWSALLTPPSQWFGQQ